MLTALSAVMGAISVTSCFTDIFFCFKKIGIIKSDATQLRRKATSNGEKLRRRILPTIPALPQKIEAIVIAMMAFQYVDTMA